MPPSVSVVKRRIPLSRPVLGGNEWSYVKECLDTAWVSSAGPFVRRFEKAFARFAGGRHAVAVSSGTAGLHLALRIVGLEPEEEVLVPDLTFVASINVVRYCGAHPVLIDADPASWQMDVGKVESFLREECSLRGGRCVDRRSGRRVRAVMPAHLLGSACEIDRLAELASRWGLRLVEDAAEAAGVRYRGRHVGTFGDVGVFSFNGNKIMTSGGGGMLVTSDARFAERARYLSTQAKDDPVEYFHREVGYNYRLSNLHAALGLAQLEQLRGFLRAKRGIARWYRKALSGCPGVTFMPEVPHIKPTYWLVTVLLPPKTTLARRKEVIRRLEAAGVEARSLWHTAHDLPPYRGARAYRIEHATDLYRRAVSLPSSPDLSEGDVRRCAGALQHALRS